MKKSSILINIIKWYMFYQSIFMYISCTIYFINDNDKWFSRLCVYIFCLAIFGILEKLHPIEDKKERRKT